MQVRACAVIAAAAAFVLSCRPAAAKNSDLWAHDNLVAWCVAPPWDAKARNSEERAQMLDELGFRLFAYNWRPKAIPTFDAEIEAMQRHHIEIVGWALYGANNPALPAIFAAIDRHDIHPELWDMETQISLAHSPEEQKQRIEDEARRVAAAAREAARHGCKLELYNHNGWGGLEDNQLAVIARLKEMGIGDVGMVYNFSHAHDADHDDTKDFPSVWSRIKDHVVAVNITGIGPTGKEDYLAQGGPELAMMRTIQDSGWRGPVGVIAELGGDAKVTLRKDLTGLDWLAAELKQPGSGGPRPVLPLR
jgi:sugar phosphate isomerase/epimerase